MPTRVFSYAQLLHPAQVTAVPGLAAAAGLPPVRLHDLRQGAALLMLAAALLQRRLQIQPRVHAGCGGASSPAGLPSGSAKAAMRQGPKQARPGLLANQECPH